MKLVRKSFGLPIKRAERDPFVQSIASNLVKAVSSSIVCLVSRYFLYSVRPVLTKPGSRLDSKGKAAP